MGLSENEIVMRLAWLKQKRLLKKIDLAFDTRMLGLKSTLVGCSIPEKKIARAGSVIDSCGNISHNYTREHRLNMWFTVSAASGQKLKKVLSRLENELAAEKMVSLPTQKVFKLRFRLDAL